MGIAERKQRLKDETRTNIINAALLIAKNDGWQALSMRKIADLIEYTTPVIYEYFDSKEALLTELTRIGFIRLSRILKTLIENQFTPVELMEKMWLAYWDFAFGEKELYQLMFGVDMVCANAAQTIPESAVPALLFKASIKGLYKDDVPDEQEISAKYYTYWSVVHGLVSINMVTQRSSEAVNKHILIQALMAISKSIAG